MSLRIHVPLVLVLCAVLSGSTRSQEPGRLTLADLPAAAQKTIKEQSVGGTLRTLWTGHNKGEKVYGAVIVTSGKRKEVVVDSAGKVVDLQQEVAVEALPAAVRKTVQGQTRGATLLSVSKEIENGIVRYEVESRVQGRSRNILIDSAGKVVEIEEQVTLDSLPAAARARIQKETGQGKVVGVESVTASGKAAIYEAIIEVAGKRSEIRVAADGSLLPAEK